MPGISVIANRTTNELSNSRKLNSDKKCIFHPLYFHLGYAQTRTGQAAGFCDHRAEAGRAAGRRGTERAVGQHGLTAGGRVHVVRTTGRKVGAVTARREPSLAATGSDFIPSLNSRALVIRRHVGFKEVAFYISLAVGIGNFFQLLVRVLVKAFITRFQPQILQTLVGNELGVLLNRLFGNADNVTADDVVTPGDFLFNRLVKHCIHLVQIEETAVLFHYFLNNIGENDAVGQLVAVNVLYLVGCSNHQAAGGEIVKEVKAVIKIHALQQVIGNQHAGKVDVAFIVNKVLIDFSDVFVAFQQDLVFTPFVIYLGAFGGGNDTLYNIGVTLRMYSLLISLNRQNQVDFRGGDVFADVRQIVGLDTVQKNQKRQNAVISSLFRGGQLLIGALVIKQRNFFRNPEVFHHQAVDFVRPLVFDVVQIKQVGNVAANHTAVDDFVISVNVKKFFSLHFSLLSGAADAFRLFQTGTVLLNGAGVIKGFDVLFPGAHYRIVNVFGANVAV